MTLIALLIIGGLALWAIAATVVHLIRDGYGRPEIHKRTRHVEKDPLAS